MTADRAIPEWVYFEGGGGNFGGCALRDLVTRDSAQEWLRACPKCSAELDGGAVEIREGRMVRAWLLRPGELPSAHDYWRMTAEGLEPAPWADVAMSGGGPLVAVA